MKKMDFRECTRAKLEDVFGLRKSLASPVLDHWLQAELSLSEHEKVVLKAFQAGLLLNIEAWNEYELSMNFIGPVLSMANLAELYRFKLFSQRTIGATVSGLDEEIELGGMPDGIVATGFWEPKIPAVMLWVTIGISWCWKRNIIRSLAVIQQAQMRFLIFCVF